MSYYRVCPCCGAALDPGERCDCQDEKKAAVSAANTDNGKAGYELTTQIPAPNVSETPGGFKSEN